MNSKKINVHIGEVKIGKGDDVLHALLGSCVGIALLWIEKKRYGLAHCLLSEAPEKSFTINGRFVDQAVLSLLAMMHIRQENYHQVQAVVAGGGNMTMPDAADSEKLVGSVNVKTALKCLKERKMKIIHQDTGGMEGKKITIYCSTGTYEIKRIPRIIEA